MKKSLLALAVLGAFAASAQAQTAVTIYGSFDGGIRHTTDVDAAGNNRTTVGSIGTYNTNRIGFRGVEDLGGGLRARFTLESGFNTGTGALDNTANRLFQRTASVGLGGTWGFVDVGRMYTVAFDTIGGFEPMNYKYTSFTAAVPAGNNANNNGGRMDNAVKYTGTFGPITARAHYSFGETAGSLSTGSSKAVGAAFVTGPLNVGAAVTRSVGPAGTTIAGLDLDSYTLGGAYKFGPARIAIGFTSNEQDLPGAAADAKTRYSWIGGSYAITPAFEFSAAFYKTKQTGGLGATPAVGATPAAAAFAGEKDFIILGTTYALSKRTNLYAAVDFADLEGGLRTAATSATPRDRQRAISVGVNHLF